MLRGIYASCCALVEQAAKADVVAANIANASTLGYRRRTVGTMSFPEVLSASVDALASHMRLGATAILGRLDFSPGTIEITNNPLDLAIEGDGLFAVRTPAGRLLLTRAGRFQLDASGRLVTPEGYAVVGDRGDIVLPPGDVRVAADGRIFVNGSRVSRLVVYSVQDPNRLTPTASGYFAPQGPIREVERPKVVQGAVEHSNVSPARELADMMAALRAYEANVRAMAIQDQSIGRLLSAVS
ncbi:MAG: flagellar hook basal-body protein [Armatimonadetes bacterium]|nr:flagellar hook basal-body protein [Armatimonadota bacterium]